MRTMEPMNLAPVLVRCAKGIVVMKPLGRPLRVAVLLFAAVFLTEAPDLPGAGEARAAEPMLVVTNDTRPGVEAVFTEADLLAMRQVTIRTRTEFTDGVVEFVGPLARNALAAIPVGGATQIHLVAANDYAYDIPISDLTEFDVILALFANGQRLSRRDKGPIWLMYPLDDHPELNEAKYNHRLVWQLTRMELR